MTGTKGLLFSKYTTVYIHVFKIH